MRPLVALLVVASCSSGPKRVGEQPSWRTSEPAKKPTSVPIGPVTFAPSSDAVTRYNEAVQPPPHTPLGDAIIAATTEAAVQAKTRVPVADARLFRACAELAQVVPEEGIVGYSLVEFALQRNGIIEPSPHLLVVWGDIDEPNLIVEQIKPRLVEILSDGANARVGIGAVKRTSDGAGAVVFALQGSGLVTTPMPRALPAGGSFTLDATILPSYHDPEVFITHDNGNTERLGLDTGKGGSFKTKVACGKHVGKQQVEVTASDTAGSTVLANFPIWCGTEPPLSVTVDPMYDDTGVVSAEESEKRLLALTNRDRATAGLPALLWDERVAEVARKHAEEMRRTKVVAHISPTTGSAADRVRVASIKTAVVLENVARAYGVGEAHGGLMNSPGHRANLMSASATHVGMGVVLGDEVSGRREMFIAQVFIRVPPKLDGARASELVRDRINQARSVNVAADLTSIAQEVAEGLAAGKAREQLWPTARRKLDGLARRYSRVGSVITAYADLEAIDGKELVGDYRPDDIGIGVAQGSHPEIGEGAAWVVVLMAEKIGR